MEIWDFFEARDATLAARSAAWDDEPYPYSAEANSKDLRGMVYGRIAVSDDSFLSVHEMIEIDGGEATRRKYAYYLMSGGAPLWGEERDPNLETAVHRQDADGTRVASEPISFEDALTRAMATRAE
jgi:hypothetical protein